MKLVLDDGTEYQIKVVDDVKVVRDFAVSLLVAIELEEMTPETVLAFVHKVLPGMKP